jgi:hypothetical protein
VHSVDDTEEWGMRVLATRLAGSGRNLLYALLMVALVASMMVPLSSQDRAEATHFRSGHGSFAWESVGDGEIEFRVQSSFRRSGYSVCREAGSTGSVPCTGTDDRPAPGDIVRETVGNTRFNFGDGSPQTDVLHFQVNAVDVDRDWLYGYALDPDDFADGEVTPVLRHTYAEDGEVTAFMETCCRLSRGGGHVNNPDGRYRVEALIDVGSPNRSPVSVMPPIVPCEIDEVCEFPVLAHDPDGDELRFRMATPQEAAGGASFNQPGEGQVDVDVASIDAETGIYTWDAEGADLGNQDHTYYSTQVIIEDLDGDGEVKSKVAVDFFIELREVVGDPPVFDPAPPEPGEPIVHRVTPGDVVTFDVGVCAADPDDDITLNVINLPDGATMDPTLPHTDVGCVSSTFTWQTPPPGGADPEALGVMSAEEDESTHLVVFQATDEHGNSTTMNYVINVVYPDPPAVPTGLAAEPGDGEVALSWEAPQDDGGAEVTGYEVVVDGDQSVAVAGTSTVVDGLTNGQEYSFTVAAVNEAGTGEATDPVTATPVAAEDPAPPLEAVLDCDDVESVTFSDVTEGEVHAEEILCAAGAGLLEGHPDGTFRPGDDLTRGQIASILWRSLSLAGLDLPAAPGAAHADAAGSVHADAIGALTEAGIIEGYEDGTFRPGTSVERAQLASLVARATEELGGDVTRSDPPYVDVAEGPHAGNIGWASDTGIIEGYEDGTFRPTGTATRAQTGAILVRWLGGLELG